MTVRHITAAANVDGDGFMIEPEVAYHGSVQGGRVAALAGPVDPSTHLNRDHPEHELGECVIATTIEVGAPLVLDEDGQFARARPRSDAMRRLGLVDMGARRTEWLQVLNERRG